MADAPGGAQRPDVGERAHANGKRTAERAEVRQEKCGDMHRAGKRALSVWSLLRLKRSAPLPRLENLPPHVP